MPLLVATNLAKYFGSESVFSGVSFQLDPGDRVGMVGPNGAGKTTLFRLLAGELEPDEGRLIRPASLRCGYLRQQRVFTGDTSVFDHAVEVFRPLLDLEKQTHAAARRLETPEVLADSRQLEQALAHHADSCRQFEEAGGHMFRARTRELLFRLGFTEASTAQPVSTLSGGQKNRLALAEVLLEDTDALLLDEPTNHLDIESTEWLEEYLRRYQGALLVVSHDRYFLDSVCTGIWELAGGRLRTYRGNYSASRQQREAERQALEARYRAEQRYLKRQLAWIEWQEAMTSHDHRIAARSRRRMLEKREWVEKPVEPKEAKLWFPDPGKGGHEVCLLEDVSKQYGDHVVFTGVNLHLVRGDRVGIIGPNGSGKSTLLRIILGEESPSAGVVKRGTGITVAEYHQEHEDLDLSRSPLAEIRSVRPDFSPTQARTFLGSLLFTGEEALRPLHEFSGGERSRLALAKIMVSKASVLALDEPTNHLDLNSRRALEKALAEFRGTLLIVSHDRYFLDQLVTQLLIVRNGAVQRFAGNYAAYVRHLHEQAAETERRRREEERRRRYQCRERRVEQERARQRRRTASTPDPADTLAEDIARRETRLHELVQQLGRPDLYQRPHDAARTQREYTALKREVEALYEQWEQALETVS